MSMPADAISAILNGTPAPLHLWVMNETSGSTFADQVSSGNAPLTAGSGCVPNGWGPIAGRRSIGGPQTPAPSFDGTANAKATKTGATLGGLALGWGIVMMMDSTVTNLASSTLYCERGNSGNDVILFRLNSGNFALTICDDTVGHSITATSPTTNTAVRGGEGQYHAGGQLLGVSVASNGKCSFYSNGPFGIGTSSQTLNAAHTWTDSNPVTYVGLDPLNTANAFSGTLCWVAVFGASFTADQFNTWYQALTPPPTHGRRWTKASSGGVYPNSAFWNTTLSSDAPLDPNSDAIVSQWITYMSAHSAYPQLSPYVPMFDLQFTGTGPAGVRTQYLATPDQHDFLSDVPTPDTLLTGDPYPSNINSDALAWVADSQQGLQYDLYAGFTTQAPGGATPHTLVPPYISTVTPSTASGSLAAGAYFYSITAVNSNGESFGPGGYNQDQKGTLSGTGKMTLSVLVETGGEPPPTGWNIYRRGPYPAAGPFGTTADYQLLTTLSSFTQGTNSFVDTGTLSPTTGVPVTLAGGTTSLVWGVFGSALTSDWASKGGGGSWDFLKNAAFNPCLKPSGATNNGESASSCPAGAGVITVEEALSGDIPHPIAVAMPSANNWGIIQGHQWPAPRHDGTYVGGAYPTMEGMRLRLSATFDPNSLTYSAYTPLATFQRGLVNALINYGLIVRDSTIGGMVIYAEDSSACGRDEWAYILGGYFTGALSTANSALGPIPWSSLQVLMPQRYPSKTDSLGRRTNRLDAAGYPTPVPY